LRHFGLRGHAAFHDDVVFVLQHMLAGLLQHGGKGIFDFRLVEKTVSQVAHRNGTAGAALVLQRRVA
jgi:hypothetical protein